MSAPRNSTSLVATALVVMVAVLITTQWFWRGNGGEGWRQIVRSDAMGYYGHLTALLVRNDLGNEPFAREYVHRTRTGTLNKYFSGSAVMMLPWFLAGHALAILDAEDPATGLGPYELKAIGVGGWSYLLIGLLALRRLLLRMSVRDEVTAVLIIAVALGTPLIQYASIQPAWSHIHSFCAVAVFLLVMHRLGNGAGAWWYIPAAALLALIILIRPVNALVVLAIPLVWNKDLPNPLGTLRNKPLPFLLALVTGLLIIAIQPFFWHAQTGNWIEWGYRNEGFYWDRPQVFNILFSYRRGLFLWTPLFALAALASMALLWKDRRRGLWSLFYWIVLLLVTSSWWIWYYGSGTGNRIFIDHYAILLIPLALVVHRLPRGAWYAAQVALFAVVALHMTQFVQYQMEILHHEHMDREKYHFTFLELDPTLKQVLGGRYEVPPYAPNALEMVLKAETDLETEHPYWRGGERKEHARAASGEIVAVMDQFDQYGPAFVVPAGHLPLGRELWLQASLMRYEPKAGASMGSHAVIAIHRPDGSQSFYETFRINYLPGRTDQQWEALHYSLRTPALNEGEELRFYIWNIGYKGRYLLDDLSVRLWAVWPYPGMTRRYSKWTEYDVPELMVGPAGFEPATKGL